MKNHNKRWPLKEQNLKDIKLWEQIKTAGSLEDLYLTGQVEKRSQEDWDYFWQKVEIIKDFERFIEEMSNTDMFYNQFKSVNK